MTQVAIGPNLAWMDDELRKAKGLTDDLRGQIDKQQVVLVDQAQRILALEDRLGKLQAQLLRIPEIEEALQHTRDEIVLMLSEARQESQRRETEFLRNRQAEREKDLKAIQEMRLELDRIQPLEQALAVRQAEDRRLNEVLLRQQQAIEDVARGVAQGEEARRLLVDGIAKNTVEAHQATSDIVELRKVQQEAGARFLPLYDGLAKVEQAVAELQTMRQELTTQQEALAERQRREDRSRAQMLTEWGRRLDGYAHQLETWADQLRFFSDQHEKNRRVLRDIQALAQELSQQQDRLRQTQRLAEEQLRRELREARGENDRRWAQETERVQQVQTAQAQRDDGQELRITDAEHALQDQTTTLQALAGRLEEARTGLLAGIARQRQMQQGGLAVFSRSIYQMIEELRETVGKES